MAKSSQNEGTNQDMVISYLTIRKAVGWLGFLFPAILFIGTWLIGGCACLRDSVSSYYYTVMVTYFAGTLCAVGLFLFTYKGYDRMDQLSSNAGAVFALGIVFFPTDITSVCTCLNIITRAPHPFINAVHYVSAGLFFVTMAYISMFLFTKTNPGQPSTKQKLKRNIVYKTCAWMMIVAMCLIPCLKLVPAESPLLNVRPEFWLESIILMSFGVSWLIKGETLLKDK